MAKGGRIQKSALSPRSTCTMLLLLSLILSILLLLLLALGIVSIPVRRAPDGFPLQEEEGLFKNKYLSVNTDADLNRSDGIDEPKQWLEVLSWEPRAFLYHNFMTKDECEYLINIGRPRMVKSAVVDSKTGKSLDSRVRTSSGTFLSRGQDKVVKAIEKRIADFTFIPIVQMWKKVARLFFQHLK